MVGTLVHSCRIELVGEACGKKGAILIGGYQLSWLLIARRRRRNPRRCIIFENYFTVSSIVYRFYHVFPCWSHSFLPLKFSTPQLNVTHINFSVHINKVFTLNTVTIVDHRCDADATGATALYQIQDWSTLQFSLTLAAAGISLHRRCFFQYSSCGKCGLWGCHLEGAA